MNVLRRFYEDYGVRLGGQAYRSFEEVEQALRRDGRLTRFLDASWPAPRPEQVVRRLLSSRESLATAADGILEADEQALLRRVRSGWSDADLPLLDEARAVLHGAPPALRARDRRRGPGSDADAAADDLPPRAVARSRSWATSRRRRARSATRAGSELLPHLPGGEGAEVEELRHAYRVPREIMSVALPLLEADRAGRRAAARLPDRRRAPRVLQAEQPLAAAFEEAARLAGEEGLLAVIAPGHAARATRRPRSSTRRASPSSPRARRKAWSSTT